MNKYEGKLGILVGGGPAPGINGVISAATIEARTQGLEVTGIYDGFRWLVKGDVSHIIPLEIRNVSRIHFTGGSILRTSRENPTKSEKNLEMVVNTLKKLQIKYLIAIGGDDTAFAASQICKKANGEIRIAHVPKTIDNDLPLPGYMPTFGFETARHVGVSLVHNLMEDSRTTNRWYLVVAMGRKAGHLALGIGKSAGVTNIIIGEEFVPLERKITIKEVCDILEGSILRRRSMGIEHGVAVVAEGIAERLDVEELKDIEGVRIDYDDYGHIRLSEIDLGKILKYELERRFAQRGEKFRVVESNIGYELRSAPPIPFDCEYVRDLGFSAVKFLLSDDPQWRALNGAMVCVEKGKMLPIPFDELLDPNTGKMNVRLVDINTDSYAVAREYMIRLEREDFEYPDQLERLAAIAKMTPEEFKKRFGYLVGINT
ncbi:6-phosphofructokinase [candidate division KSB1 bacterium]|nr:6-phosphofructokinase [bacterium]OQX57456.1 MAG: 6-phosphofructokinase [candidate division KSB1 bacterium 4484_219]RKY77716.1 MAG: 6-phosphofructokinase [candidate division KSB1 bacterium]